MAKKTIKVKCVSISANKTASVVQFAEDIKPIAGAQPGAPNATAKTLLTVNFQFDPLKALDFVPEKDYTITIE